MSVIPLPVPERAKGVTLAGRYGPTGAKREAAERVWHIRDGLLIWSDTIAIIKVAYIEQDHLTLGYPDWETYLRGEFGVSAFPRLSKAQRKDLVAELSGLAEYKNGVPLEPDIPDDGDDSVEDPYLGMSLRAIAAVLGVSKSTVANDLAELSNSGQLPADETEPTQTETEPTQTTQGLDGKQHPKTKPATKTKPAPAKTAPETAPWDEATAETLGHLGLTKAAGAGTTSELALNLAEAWAYLDAVAVDLENVSLSPGAAASLKPGMDAVTLTWARVQKAYAKACGEES